MRGLSFFHADRKIAGRNVAASIAIAAGRGMEWAMLRSRT
jgi:hypothetical protein